MKSRTIKNLLQITWLFTGVIWFTACNGNEPDADRQQILNILKNERIAHLNKNSDLFIAEFADSVYQISNGKVEYISKVQLKKHIVDYFNRSKIVKWDDLQAPVIRFSKDQTMAYTIVKKLVVTEPGQSASAVKKDTIIFSWVSIYGKSGGEWRLACNVSTRN
jgi:hypothetical protein